MVEHKETKDRKGKVSEKTSYEGFGKTTNQMLKESNVIADCSKMYEEDDNSDKENEYMDDKENDLDWTADSVAEVSQKTIPTSSRRGRKPLGELITLIPEERDLSEYEKLQIKRKAEQRVMLDAMKKASINLSKAVIPKPVRRQMVKSKAAYFPSTRKEPPILRSRRNRHNSRGSSNQSSETGETDDFVYLPAKREYDLYSDDEEDEYDSYKPKVYNVFLYLVVCSSCWKKRFLFGH